MGVPLAVGSYLQVQGSKQGKCLCYFDVVLEPPDQKLEGKFLLSDTGMFVRFSVAFRGALSTIGYNSILIYIIFHVI